MRNAKHIQNLLLSLFVIYYAQGSLYTTGSIVSQGALAIILGVSSIYFGKTFLLSNNKNAFYKVWTALLLLNIIGFFFTGSFSNSYHFGMFKGILMTALPFYPFYHFSQNGVLKSQHLLLFFLAMLPITILQYFLNANQILAERVTDNTNIVNNIAYSFVALMPYVFFFKRKKIIAVGAMLILLFFIIQGAKRGALIIGGIGVIGFTYFQLRTVPKKNRFKGYLFILVAVIGMSYYAYDLYVNNEYLMSRMQNLSVENSSGRDIIYLNIFNGWIQSDNIFNLLFGYGFAASLSFSGGSFAHNDWLELLSNFGFLGICVYSVLFYTVFRNISSSIWNNDKRLLLLTIVLIWLFTTLFSMSYMSGNGFMQTILLAYILGSRNRYLE